MAVELFEIVRPQFVIDYSTMPDGQPLCPNTPHFIFDSGTQARSVSGGKLVADHNPSGATAVYRFHDQRVPIIGMEMSFEFEEVVDGNSNGAATLIATAGGFSDVNKDVIGVGGGSYNPSASGSLHLVWTEAAVFVQYWDSGTLTTIDTISQTLTAGVIYSAGWYLLDGELCVRYRASTGVSANKKIVASGISTLLSKIGRFGCHEISGPQDSNKFKFHRVTAW